MKLTKQKLKRLIQEAIITAIDPGVAKDTAVDLMEKLDQKIKNDPNFQPYYDKIHELYKDIVSGEYFSRMLDNDAWLGGEQAISLIESLLMIMPEDQEYQSG